MLIGELSRKTGLSRDTIRFYEKQGLIQLGRKERRENSYKKYSTDVLARLMAIRRIKSFSFTLNEVSDLLYLIEEKEATCEKVGLLLSEKVALLEAKIRELAALRDHLLHSVHACPGPADNAAADNCPLIATLPSAPTD